jgi:hypothetical protein
MGLLSVFLNDEMVFEWSPGDGAAAVKRMADFREMIGESFDGGTDEALDLANDLLRNAVQNNRPMGATPDELEYVSQLIVFFILHQRATGETPERPGELIGKLLSTSDIGARFVKDPAGSSGFYFEAVRREAATRH